MAATARAYSPSLLVLEPDLLQRLDAHCSAKREDPNVFVADAITHALDAASGGKGRAAIDPAHHTERADDTPIITGTIN